MSTESWFGLDFHQSLPDGTGQELFKGSDVLLFLLFNWVAGHEKNPNTTGDKEHWQ